MLRTKVHKCVYRDTPGLDLAAGTPCELSIEHSLKGNRTVYSF